MTYTKQVPAAGRTLRLLETLAATPQGLSAAELVEQLEISRSSLFALLNTLKNRNYIEQTDGRRYRAGPALYALVPSGQRTRQALIDAFHADAELNSLPETIALTRLDGHETVIIAQQESAHPVRVVLSVGQHRPAATTADGLALLAGLEDAALKSSLPEHVDILTPNLQQVRQNGLAQSRSGDAVELAFPICPNGTQPDTALLVTIPAFRYRANETTLQLLRSAAARLSYRIGATIYQPYGQTAPELVGPTAPLEPGDLAQFLSGPWAARLACVRTDGTPHVVPLWYEWDGQAFWVTASPRASWGNYLQENSGVALAIDEPWPPLRRVLVSGQAQTAPDSAIPGGLTGLRERLVQRYLGKKGDTPPAGKTGWQAFKIIPDKIIGQRGLVR